MSDEVSSFLRSVEQLNQGRDENEEARSRELEEKILQQRRERQARREERARSISPQKSSPANTPPPSARRKDSTPHVTDAPPILASSPIPDLSAALQSHTIPSPSADPMDLSTARSPTKEAEMSLDLDLKRSSASYASPPPSAGLARTPTLSWQRRPPSQGPGPRSRPLSMVAAENAAVRSSTPSAESTSPDRTPTRDQISQALASKDPAWFRQTADRGANSAAYRKNQVEDADTVDVSSGRTQLAGMSRPTSIEQEGDAAGRDRQDSPRNSRIGSSLLLMTEAQKLGPPADIQSGGDAPAPGNASPTRPASPTKGMGGFVQSAMMKRTDSVKRWSVTTPGLHRHPTGDRSSYDSKSGANSPGREATSRPVSRSKESSSRPASRPTSSHAKDAPPSSATDTAAPPKETAAASPKPELTVPEPDPEQTIPTSPSKTMDPRRWSPTKSSWLDAALKQPESPKPKPAAMSNQPAWMVELNKAKAAKAKNGSVDLDRTVPTAVKKHEVKTGGLVRPAPLGTTVKQPSLSGITSPSIGIDKPTTPGLRSGGFSKSPAVGSPSPTTEKPLTPTLRNGAFEKGTAAGSPSPTAEKPSTPSLRSGEFNKSPAIGKLSPPTADPDRRGSVAGHELGKEKPEAPPKKDFRANLRPRGTTLGNVDKSESTNELANVFGKLRKTTTQNYVAPDELKDNIMRGKSGLNITGGPRPYVKKDDFKDALLARKADFKQAKEEGRGVATNVKPPQEQVIPEGIARRATITRSKSISHSRGSSVVGSTAPEEPTRAAEPSKPAEPPQPSPRAVTEEGSALTARQTEAAPLPALSKEKSTPGKLPNKIGGSALANRFNPALAGLLARGPPGVGGAANDAPGTSSAKSTSDAGNEPGPGPQLTHMTKNRARGPRRKAPASAGKSSAPVSAEDAVATSAPNAEAAAAKEVEKKGLSPPVSPAVAPPAESTAVQRKANPPPVVAPKPSVEPPVKPPSEQPLGAVAADKTRTSGVISLVDSSKKTLEEQRPVPSGTRIALVDSTKPKPGPGSPNKIFEQVAAIAAKAQPVEEKKVDEPPSRSPSPRKLDARRMSRFLDESSLPSLKNEPEPTKPISPVRKSFGGPPSPAKVSSVEKVDSQPTMSVKNGAAVFNRSITPPKPQEPEEKKPAPPPKPALEPLNMPSASPPKTIAAKTAPIEPVAAASPSTLTSPTRSPSKSGSDVSAMLKDFFGSQRSRREYRADAGEILMNRPRGGSTVQTQKAQLYQITEQGKRVPVPSHYERVLFEREMYLCAHTFTNAARKKVQEVYFWAGDEVASSVVEDAQVFVSREAKSLGGTLIKMRQGKETAEFIQALGGIVIIRRGSSNKYDSLAPNMLCGRSYLGQIVFDEVDFAPLTLCSGFPYIVTQSGKCYLWKGKGSGIDELSCARLIGMDSALMGELTEVEEGKEPAQFWDLFDGKKKMSSADHWRLKPSYDKYCGRLFCSDAADPRQINEISPFSQSDLSSTKVYVLDAFFEMYIIVGKNAQSEYASFHNALDFAQEYAILAAGMEDRPFVPISTVVLEGIPRDMRSCFRKWRDELSPTRTAPTSSPSSAGAGVGGRPSALKRTRSLKIVSLGQALQVLGNSG